MSSTLGTIRIELKLDDGEFRVRTIRAGKVVKEMAGKFDDAAKSLKRLERSITGLLPKLRDVAITASILKGGLRNLYNVTLGWQKAIIDTNADLERMSFLLKGMSDEVTALSREKDAADNLAYLFDMAERSPFSLGEITNSFVKMRSVGIKQTEDAIKSLTDSVAAFGGNDQILHRASVAIQQMAGKGVISMEELRQQLGEAVPNAIRLMARSLAMSYQELVDAVSKGRVEAHSALERMFREMDRTMGGAGLRMMDTWSGMVSRLETRWIKFQKAIGDAGFFKEAKYALSDAISALDPGAVEKYAQFWGRAMASVVRGLADFTHLLINHGDTIVRVTKAVGGLLIAYKSYKILFGSIIPAYKSLIVTLYAAGRAAVNYAAMTNDFARNHRAATVAAGGLSKTITGLRGAIAAMGGPIGLIVNLLGSAAIAWYTFGNAAEEAWNKVKEGEEIYDRKSLQSLKEALKEKEEEYRNYINVVEEIRNGGGTAGELVSSEKKLARLYDEIINARKVISETTQRLDDADVRHRAEVFKRQLEREVVDLRGAYKKASQDLEAEYLKSKETDNPMTQEERRVKQAKIISELYDDMIAIYQAKQTELNAKMAKLDDANSKEADHLREKIAIVGDLISQTLELSEQQSDMALRAPTFVDGTTGGDKQSKLEGFIGRTKGKIEEYKGELAGLTGEVERFKALLESGTFGKEGLALLKDVPEQKARLAEIIALIEQEQEYKKQLKERVKAQREAEAATERLATLQGRLATNARTVREEFGTDVEARFINTTRRKIEELIAKLPEAERESKKTKEAIEAMMNSAYSIQGLSAADKMIKEARQINDSLLRERDRYDVEYQRKVKQAHDIVNLANIKNAEDRIVAAESLNAYLKALADKHARDMETPIQKLAREWEDSTQRMREASANWLDDATNRLVEFAKTGKFEFGEFAQSILADILRIQTQKIFSNVDWGAIGGSIGAIFSADGNVVGPHGVMPLRAYATGGVAYSPQVSIFGEGDLPEAYVPLPDGRTIPVTIKGGMQQSTAAAVPDIAVNVINQSGQEMNAHQGRARFDGKKFILDVVLEAANKPGPFRDGIRSIK